MSGLEALAMTAIVRQDAWNVLTAEALAGRCNESDCAVADSDIGTCPGWCAVVIAGFEG